VADRDAARHPAEPGVWVTGGPRGGRANALAVSPNFANDSLALTGEWMQGRYGDQSGLGIFKSTDGGQNWRPVISDAQNSAYYAAVHAFAFSPGFVADQTVFAGTGGGLFKSSDGGESWQWVTSAYAGPPGSIMALPCRPTIRRAVIC